jgi:undecaprenyl pyrophosphate synthase
MDIPHAKTVVIQKEMKTKMNIYQEKMEAVIRRRQEETKAAINYIRAELEETIKNRMKNVLTSVDQRTQGLRKELNEEINEPQEEGRTTVGKRAGAEEKGGDAGVYIKAPPPGAECHNGEDRA